MNLLDTMPTDVEDLVVVREQLNEDNDPSGPAAEHTLPGCRVVARAPSPDSDTTGERVTRYLDVRCPDRTADVLATDRIRRRGEPAGGRARWLVDGEPARSPFDHGGCVFVLVQRAG